MKVPPQLQAIGFPETNVIPDKCYKCYPNQSYNKGSQGDLRRCEEHREVALDAPGMPPQTADLGAIRQMSLELSGHKSIRRVFIFHNKSLPLSSAP